MSGFIIQHQKQNCQYPKGKPGGKAGFSCTTNNRKGLMKVGFENYKKVGFEI
jgi:hypothetical protein